MIQISQLVLIMPHHISSLVKSAVSFFGPLGSVLLLASLAWGNEPIVSESALHESQAPREQVIEKPPTDELGSGAIVPPDQAQDSFTSPPVMPPPYSVPENEKVHRFLTLFQSPQKREVVDRWLSRSGRYLEMIREIFRQKGLPEDLAYTAMIESGFNPVAVSKAGAKGLWQFMEGTARRYGLVVDRWVDERLDPEKSTRAAADYLRDLFDQFGSWVLAQAAYNAGEVKVAQAIQRSGSRDFWRLSQTPHLRDETKQFVPAIAAVTLIAKEPERFGFRVTYQKAEPIEVVSAPVSLALRTIAQWTGVALETVRSLNPELRRGITPPTAPYTVKLPAGSRGRFEAQLAQLESEAGEGFAIHTVRQGQNLAHVARLYRTSPEEIQSLNGLSNGALRVGSDLVVPVSAPMEPAKRSTQARAVLLRVQLPPAVYVVRPGDTLETIALRYRVSADEIAHWNGLAKNAAITPGDSLRLTPRTPAGS